MDSQGGWAHYDIGEVCHVMPGPREESRQRDELLGCGAELREVRK